MTRREVPRLHLIGPLAMPDPMDYAQVASEATAGGCDAVHVRLPGKPARDVMDLAVAVRERLEGRSSRLIVNDRIDVALLVGADGVQLGEHSLSVGDARRIIGDRMLIGRSVHDVEGAAEAESAGANYLLAGHIFETNSKAGLPGRGLDWLGEIVAAVNIPVIAIGGITVERLEMVMKTGTHGVAMGRELLFADEPKHVAREASRIIDGFGGG